MTDTLLLLSGNDIPFEDAQLILHPPTIKEIGFIGEDSLWGGVEFLNFSKELLSNEDKIRLSSKTDFEVFMSVLQHDDLSIKMRKTQMELVLTLLFPQYHINFSPSSIIFQHEEDKVHLLMIDENTFTPFKELIKAIFCLDQLKGDGSVREYKPANVAAELLVQKFKDRKKKLAQIKKNEGEGGLGILSSYVSILAVAANHDINTLMNYTVYQLVDEFRRYQLKMSFDINMQARMAGAQDIKEAENWMKNIHLIQDEQET